MPWAISLSKGAQISGFMSSAVSGRDTHSHHKPGQQENSSQFVRVQPHYLNLSPQGSPKPKCYMGCSIAGNAPRVGTRPRRPAAAPGKEAKNVGISIFDQFLLPRSGGCGVTREEGRRLVAQCPGTVRARCLSRPVFRPCGLICFLVCPGITLGKGLMRRNWTRLPMLCARFFIPILALARTMPIVHNSVPPPSVPSYPPRFASVHIRHSSQVQAWIKVSQGMSKIQNDPGWTIKPSSWHIAMPSGEDGNHPITDGGDCQPQLQRRQGCQTGRLPSYMYGHVRFLNLGRVSHRQKRSSPRGRSDDMSGLGRHLPSQDRW